MKAREIDQLIQQEIFKMPTFLRYDGEWLTTSDLTGRKVLIPHYSTKIEDAWLVLEELRRRDILIDVETFKDYYLARAHFEHEDLGYCEIEGSQYSRNTPEEAICMTALKSTGIEI